jgi:putative membrane protein
MIRLAALLGLLGLAIVTAIIIWSGYDQLLQALGQAGWGILWTSLYHLVPLMCSAIGWHALAPGKNRPSLPFITYTLWLRSSVNNLMPVARIGGEVVAVRVMMKHGIIKTTAIASTVVELTTSVVGVFLFDIIGISLFALHITDRHTVWQLVIGLLLSVPAITAFVLVQRMGLFGLFNKIFALMVRDKWKDFMGSAAKLDRAVHVMYRRKQRVLICAVWQFIAWVSGAGEIWLALYFLGNATSLLKAIMLEALIQASASVAFAVPGALGVQEAGFVVFGQMLGLTSETAVALAVIRRCRDLLLYVPGLIVWQLQEGRWLLRKKRAAP